MIKYLPLLFAFFLVENLEAQIGIKFGYRTLENTEWEAGLSEKFMDDFSSIYGWSAGINYWFRLKSRRIEFTPEFSVGRVEGDTPRGINREHSFQSFHFNTNIYLLDLGEDCDCPVWSKDGNFFQKGFFIQASPGVTRMVNNLDGELLISNDKKIYLEFGVGAGVDFGISDFLTITPMAKMFISPNAVWGGIFGPLDSSPKEYEGRIRQFFIGLKLGFRFDELR